MTTILAVDPGPVRSAWLLLEDGRPLESAVIDNADLIDDFYLLAYAASVVVIERVASYGMPVGDEVFETVYWTGRLAQAAGRDVERIPRKTVVTTLCGSARAKDPNVRQALIDRFGGPDAIRKGGLLHGIHGDLWAALAVAVAWDELQRERVS